MIKNKTKIKGFIFDLDHTLLDSDKIQIEAAIQACAKFNVQVTFKEFLVHFDKATDAMFRSVVGSTFNGNFEDITKEHTRILIQNVAKIPPYPGANAILHKIFDTGGKICFASNNFNIVIDEILKILQWDKLCVGFVGIDDVIHCKPHPEMIEQAIAKLGIPTGQCVVVGDSIYDIQAGHAANTKTIAICTGSYSRLDFENLKPGIDPTFILDKIADLTNKIPLIC
jgi:HAD superfamily hydrolase (TIGR01509 family)